MITKINSVAIPIHDQRKAIDFYVNKLGMELLMDAPGGYGEGENTNWVEVGPAGTVTRISLTPAPMMGREPGGMTSVFLVCDDAEATTAQFRANGVEISHEIEAQPWGRFFQFKDLDSNEYMIVQLPTEGMQQ